MCFDNGCCDWTADIHEETRQRSNKLRHCYECRQEIAEGDWFTHIYQQEHEECHCEICELNAYDESDFPKEECEQYFGETFECDYCEDCRLIRHAIYQVEKDEGCPEYARQPLYGELNEVFTEHSNALQYALRAISLFTHLETNVLLKPTLNGAIKGPITYERKIFADRSGSPRDDT